jgi:4-diphosphocytidyl-2C-methyl-D-erythritol kinase
MTVRETAYAKINLYLDVTGRRDDGFHDILSVMHSVSLADVIIVDADCSDENRISLTTDSPELSVDSSNLVYKAAEKYLEKAGNSPAAISNRAILQWLKGNEQEAYRLIQIAANAGCKQAIMAKEGMEKRMK